MPTLAEILAKKSSQPKPETAGATLIRASDEREQLAAKIKTTLDTTSPKAQSPASEPRELGATTPGERIPMDHPKEGATETEWEWFNSLHSFNTDLCIVVDPSDPSTAWVALRSRPMDQPLLLHKLPVVNRPGLNQPF